MKQPDADQQAETEEPRTQPLLRAPKCNALPDAATIGEIIEMALSDHVSFAQIRSLHGLGPDQVKALMRGHLAPGSYRAWRRRLRRFADRRAVYK